MENNQKIRSIGVKDLGNLVKEDFCPRCFWYERKYGPFPSFFPGIFNVIDKNLKNSVWLRWKNERKLPNWLGIDNVKRVLTIDSLGEIEKRHNQKYLVFYHQETEFILRGAPDLILELEDGTIHLIDFKTGRFKEDKDPFLPMYETQLNGYVFLATKVKVSKLSLAYFNPIDNIPQEIFTEINFKLDFEPKIVPVEIKPNLIPELLKKAKEILDLETPPPPRENCQSICRHIDKIISQPKVSL